MRRLSAIVIAAISGIAFGQVASAADLPVKAPVYKAPIVARYNWTGFYVGGNIGYSWGKGDTNVVDPGLAPAPTSYPISLKLDGLIGGGQIGYNFQIDPSWVVGLEADIQGSAEKNSSNRSDPNCPDGCISTLNQTRDAKILWFGTVRGRAGFLVTPTMLLYATGGLAYGEVSVSGVGTTDFFGGLAFSGSKTNFGWTVGGGLEGAFPNSRDWTWKVEYVYLDLGSIDGTGVDTMGPNPFTWSAKFTDNILRVGVNYRFH